MVSVRLRVRGDGNHRGEIIRTVTVAPAPGRFEAATKGVVHSLPGGAGRRPAGALHVEPSDLDGTLQEQVWT